MDSRSIKSFFQVGSLLMVLVALGLLGAIVTMHFAIHGAEVQVPALKGMTVSEALSQTAGLGLNLSVDNRFYSSDVAAGHILTQSPAAGTVVRREWQVRVSESLGPQQVDVPDVVGREERVAQLELRRVGLNVGVTAHLPYVKATPGTVIAQDPAAHAQNIGQPTVNLLVAVPETESVDGYVMPDLVGQLAVSAVAQLGQAGVKATTKLIEVPIGQVAGNGPIRPPVPPGAVTAQMPAAGERIDQNTVVHLLVAR